MLPLATSSMPVLPPASALSPAAAVEAPAVADTSNSDWALDDDAVVKTIVQRSDDRFRSSLKPCVIDSLEQEPDFLRG